MIDNIAKIKEILASEGSIELASYKCHRRLTPQYLLDKIDPNLKPQSFQKRAPSKWTQRVDLSLRLQSNRITMLGLAYVPKYGPLCFDIPKDILLKFVETNLLFRPIHPSNAVLKLHPALVGMEPVDAWADPATVDDALQARVDRLEDGIMNGVMDLVDVAAAHRQQEYITKRQTTLKILAEAGFFRVCKPGEV